MGMTRLLLAAGALWASVAAQADPANVLSATATSSAKASTAVGCLLQTDCKGSWSPGSVDSGANEGVYIQFETPVSVDAVELVTNDRIRNEPYTLSVNGAPASAADSPKPVGGHGNDAYAVRYAIPGSHVKSVFFRLGVREGGWRHFSLYSIRFYRGNQPVNLTLPRLAPATVTATSQLDPKVAYQPANLFDSRYDFAWSTDGKTTTGPGESLEIKFSAPQDLSGIIIWNGYQRSNAHFSANGRVSRLTIASGQGSEDVAVTDKSGAQRIALPTPLKDASSVRLTIAGIYPGEKYMDVLLSELRFIDSQGRILLPEVVGLEPTPSARTAELVDRSLSSVACSSSFSRGNFQRNLRLRKDGSFVIYAKAYDDDGKNTDQVLEGNWSQAGDEVRIFGKRYAETVLQTEYSQTKMRVPASIFQSDLRIARFQELAPHDKKQLVALIWTRLGGRSSGEGAEDFSILGTGGKALASGTDEKTLLEGLTAALDKLNPWTIRSPILADAMLPSDEVGACDQSR